MCIHKIVMMFSNARAPVWPFWRSKISTLTNYFDMVFHVVHKMWLLNCEKNMMNVKKIAKKRSKWKTRNHPIWTKSQCQSKKLTNLLKSSKTKLMLIDCKNKNFSHKNVYFLSFFLWTEVKLRNFWIANKIVRLKRMLCLEIAMLSNAN